MNSEKVRELQNRIYICKEIFGTVCERLGQNKMGNPDIIPINNPVENEDYAMVFSLKGFFEQDVKVCFRFSEKVTGYLSYIIKSVFFEYLQELLYNAYITEEMKSEYIMDIYQDIVKKFRKSIKKLYKLDLEDITGISAMYYEGNEANGNIYLILNETSITPLRISQKNKERICICRNSWRKIRKNLEVAYDPEAKGVKFPPGLAFTYNKSWEMAGVVDGFDDDAKVLRIHFVKHMVWELYANEELIIRYNCGNYEGARKDNYIEFFERIRLLITNVDENKIKELWKIAEAAIDQKHGTILIIATEAEAEKEAFRIAEKSAGILLEKQNVNADMVKRLTTVDGALFADDTGNLLGYGMILDTNGKDIQVEKDQGRGSRFHSAKKYIKYLQSDGKCALAVIVSEDGMINFYSTKDAVKEKVK